MEYDPFKLQFFTLFPLNISPKELSELAVSLSS